MRDVVDGEHAMAVVGPVHAAQPVGPRPGPEQGPLEAGHGVGERHVKFDALVQARVDVVEHVDVDPPPLDHGPALPLPVVKVVRVLEHKRGVLHGVENLLLLVDILRDRPLDRVVLGQVVGKDGRAVDSGRQEGLHDVVAVLRPFERLLELFALFRQRTDALDTDLQGLRRLRRLGGVHQEHARLDVRRLCRGPGNRQSSEIVLVISQLASREAVRPLGHAQVARVRVNLRRVSSRVGRAPALVQHFRDGPVHFVQLIGQMHQAREASHLLDSLHLEQDGVGHVVLIARLRGVQPVGQLHLAQPEPRDVFGQVDALLLSADHLIEHVGVLGPVPRHLFGDDALERQARDGLGQVFERDGLRE